MRNNLYKLRKNMHLSQEDVAKKLGISRSYYGHIETGERYPSLILAKKIADFFETSIDDIFFTNYCYITKQNIADIF